METGDDADPAIGQGIFRRHHVAELQHRTLAPRLHREEQDDDGEEGDGRDDKVDVQCHQHAAIVKCRQHHDDGGNDAPVVPVGEAIAGISFDRVGDHDGVRHFKHGVGEHQIECHIEGHQRADDVFGLRVLAASGSHG